MNPQGLSVEFLVVLLSQVERNTERRRGGNCPRRIPALSELGDDKAGDFGPVFFVSVDAGPGDAEGAYGKAGSDGDAVRKPFIDYQHVNFGMEEDRIAAPRQRKKGMGDYDDVGFGDIADLAPIA